MDTIQITFKSPDVADHAVENYLQDIENHYLLELDRDSSDELTEAELETLEERKQEARDRVMPVVCKWIEFGEYLSVELDLDTGTCTVLAKS